MAGQKISALKALIVGDGLGSKIVEIVTMRFL
jgi:hypothetical protein